MSSKHKPGRGFYGAQPVRHNPFASFSGPRITFVPPERVELDLAVFFNRESTFQDDAGDFHPFAVGGVEKDGKTPVSYTGAMLAAKMRPGVSGSDAEIVPIRVRDAVFGPHGEIVGKPTIETVEYAVAVCPHCGRVLVDSELLVGLGVERKDARAVTKTLGTMGVCPQCKGKIDSVEAPTDEDLASVFGWRLAVRLPEDPSLLGDVDVATAWLPTPLEKTLFETKDDAIAAKAKLAKRLGDASSAGEVSLVVTEDETSISITGQFTASVVVIPQATAWRLAFTAVKCFPAEPPRLPEYLVSVASLGDVWPDYRDKIADDELRQLMTDMAGNGYPFLIESLPVAMSKGKGEGRVEVDETKFYFKSIDQGGDYVTSGWHLRPVSAGRMMVDDFPVMDKDALVSKFLFIEKSKFVKRNATISIA